MARVSIPDSQRFFNRHLSWMQFNQRVLEEARDASNPLLERVKFLGITASNLDEFVEVRLAGLMQQAEHGNSEPGPDGRVPEQVLAELTSKIHGFVDEQYECWRDELVPALEAESVRVLGRSDLRPEAREYIENFYTRTVEPILTPVTVDPAHPFPHVLNKALCLAFLLKRKRRGSQIYLESSPCRARCRASCACRPPRTKLNTCSCTTLFTPSLNACITDTKSFRPQPSA